MNAAIELRAEREETNELAVLVELLNATGIAIGNEYVLDGDQADCFELPRSIALAPEATKESGSLVCRKR